MSYQNKDIPLLNTKPFQKKGGNEKRKRPTFEQVVEADRKKSVSILKNQEHLISKFNQSKRSETLLPRSRAQSQMQLPKLSFQQSLITTQDPQSYQSQSNMSLKGSTVNEKLIRKSYFEANKIRMPQYGGNSKIRKVHKNHILNSFRSIGGQTTSGDSSNQILPHMRVQRKQDLKLRQNLNQSSAGELKQNPFVREHNLVLAPQNALPIQLHAYEPYQSTHTSQFGPAGEAMTPSKIEMLSQNLIKRAQMESGSSGSRTTLHSHQNRHKFEPKHIYGDSNQITGRKDLQNVREQSSTHDFKRLSVNSIKGRSTSVGVGLVDQIPYFDIQNANKTNFDRKNSQNTTHEVIIGQNSSDNRSVNNSKAHSKKQSQKSETFALTELYKDSIFGGIRRKSLQAEKEEDLKGLSFKSEGPLGSKQEVLNRMAKFNIGKRYSKLWKITDRNKLKKIDEQYKEEIRNQMKQIKKRLLPTTFKKKSTLESERTLEVKSRMEQLYKTNSYNQSFDETFSKSSQESIQNVVENNTKVKIVSPHIENQVQPLRQRQTLRRRNANPALVGSQAPLTMWPIGLNEIHIQDDDLFQVWVNNVLRKPEPTLEEQIKKRIKLEEKLRLIRYRKQKVETECVDNSGEDEKEETNFRRSLHFETLESSDSEAENAKFTMHDHLRLRILMRRDPKKLNSKEALFVERNKDRIDKEREGVSDALIQGNTSPTLKELEQRFEHIIENEDDVMSPAKIRRRKHYKMNMTNKRQVLAQFLSKCNEYLLNRFIVHNKDQSSWAFNLDYSKNKKMTSKDAYLKEIENERLLFMQQLESLGDTSDKMIKKLELQEVQNDIKDKEEEALLDEYIETEGKIIETLKEFGGGLNAQMLSLVDLAQPAAQLSKVPLDAISSKILGQQGENSIVAGQFASTILRLIVKQERIQTLQNQKTNRRTSMAAIKKTDQLETVSLHRNSQMDRQADSVLDEMSILKKSGTIKAILGKKESTKVDILSSRRAAKNQKIKESKQTEIFQESRMKNQYLAGVKSNEEEGGFQQMISKNYREICLRESKTVDIPIFVKIKGNQFALLGYKLNSGNLKALGAFLEQSVYILDKSYLVNSLHFEDNGLRDEDFAQVVNGLSSQGVLHEFVYGQNEFGLQTVLALALLVQAQIDSHSDVSKTLQHIVVKRVKTQPIIMETFFKEVLREMPVLRRIHLSSINLGSSHCVKELSKVIEKKQVSLETIELRNCSFNAEQLSKIANQIYLCQRVRLLDLSENSLITVDTRQEVSKQFITYICDLLKDENASLQHLNLSNLSMNFAHMTSIVQAVSLSKTLTSIHLSNNLVEKSQILLLETILGVNKIGSSEQKQQQSCQKQTQNLQRLIKQYDQKFECAQKIQVSQNQPLQLELVLNSQIYKQNQHQISIEKSNYEDFVTESKVTANSLLFVRNLYNPELSLFNEKGNKELKTWQSCLDNETCFVCDQRKYCLVFFSRLETSNHNFMSRVRSDKEKLEIENLYLSQSQGRDSQNPTIFGSFANQESIEMITLENFGQQLRQRLSQMKSQDVENTQYLLEKAKEKLDDLVYEQQNQELEYEQEVMEQQNEIKKTKIKQKKADLTSYRRKKSRVNAIRLAAAAFRSYEEVNSDFSVDEQSPFFELVQKLNHTDPEAMLVNYTKRFGNIDLDSQRRGRHIDDDSSFKSSEITGSEDEDQQEKQVFVFGAYLKPGKHLITIRDFDQRNDKVSYFYKEIIVEPRSQTFFKAAYERQKANEQSQQMVVKKQINPEIAAKNLATVQKYMQKIVIKPFCEDLPPQKLKQLCPNVENSELEQGLEIFMNSADQILDFFADLSSQESISYPNISLESFKDFCDEFGQGHLQTVDPNAGKPKKKGQIEKPEPIRVDQKVILQDLFASNDSKIDKIFFKKLPQGQVCVTLGGFIAKILQLAASLVLKDEGVQYTDEKLTASQEIKDSMTFCETVKQLVKHDLPNTFKNFWIINKTIGQNCDKIEIPFDSKTEFEEIKYDLRISILRKHLLDTDSNMHRILQSYKRVLVGVYARLSTNSQHGINFERCSWIAKILTIQAFKPKKAPKKTPTLLQEVKNLDLSSETPLLENSSIQLCFARTVFSQVPSLNKVQAEPESQLNLKLLNFDNFVEFLLRISLCVYFMDEKVAKKATVGAKKLLLETSQKERWEQFDVFLMVICRRMVLSLAQETAISNHKQMEVLSNLLEEIPLLTPSTADQNPV